MKFQDLQTFFKFSLDPTHVKLKLVADPFDILNSCNVTPAEVVISILSIVPLLDMVHYDVTYMNVISRDLQLTCL